MSLELSVLPSGYIQTNAFLLQDRERGEAILIDAPHFVWVDVEPLLKESGCKLVALLLTHGHYDHMGDGCRIQGMGVPTYGHKDDEPLYSNPARMLPYAYPPDIKLDPVPINHWVDDGDTIELLGHKIEVRHVPGHCPGNILFYFPELKSAFVGDALFAGSIGRYDLPGGDFTVLEKSIRERIYTLPDDVEVMPGHGPSTLVGDEKETNPHVRP
ncbi:MBL fold metallo-hydrolase [Puniceicoccaceae bacterium K14]|nr:MBL fold metallo-hydrolase [Puniceicoccaceae bacterium K14]